MTRRKLKYLFFLVAGLSGQNCSHRRTSHIAAFRASLFWNRYSRTLLIINKNLIKVSTFHPTKTVVFFNLAICFLVISLTLQIEHIIVKHRFRFENAAFYLPPYQ